MATRLEDYAASPVFKGRIIYEPGWYLLDLPDEVHARFAPAIAALGFAIEPAKRPHISIVKDEAPSRRAKKFGKAFVNEIVAFRCDEQLQYENGRHVWIHCFSERLCELREYFSLPTLRRDDQYRVNFHSTLGRIKAPFQPELRAQLRITPATHIDLETLMQHI